VPKNTFERNSKQKDRSTKPQIIFPKYTQIQSIKSFRTTKQHLKLPADDEFSRKPQDLELLQ